MVAMYLIVSALGTAWECGFVRPCASDAPTVRATASPESEAQG